MPPDVPTRSPNPLTLGAYPGLREETLEPVEGVTLQRDVPIRLRDGVTIRADLFRPTAGRDVPCVICWAPYGKHPHLNFQAWPGADVPADAVSEYTPFEAPDPLVWAKAGYAVLFPDPRGMWGSEGAATFFEVSEALDEYDTIEWAAGQDWSNGKVGLLGVSYLAISQWSAAALRPPHLSAIIPWEGVTDLYRELFFHGGIPNTQMVQAWQPLVSFSALPVEDMEAASQMHPMFDDYWEAKVPPLKEIDVPAYVVASWTDHALHTRGTLEGFKHIASASKYLEIHGRKKWQYFYERESVLRQLAFFDRYLRDRENAILDWPSVRLEVRESYYNGKTRSESEWPLARTEYRQLFLDLQHGGLVEAKPSDEAVKSYVSTNVDRLQLDYTFSSPTELTGHAKLRLWLSTSAAQDADIFVGVQKIDASGASVPFPFFSTFDDGPVALGWLRASHRELDLERSTEWQPFHTHRERQPLTPGEPVQLDIEIWPFSVQFMAGESLRLLIQGSDINRYRPGLFAPGHWESVNSGRHFVHAGGKFDTYLLLPFIP